MTGLKIDNSKSKFTLDPHIDIEAEARTIGKKIEDNKAEAFNLGSKYLEILKDKTVPENKGTLVYNLEKEILAKLLEFAKNVNNDDNELEGMGSIALCTLLFRSCLHLRDKANDLDYKVAQQNKEIAYLKKQLISLSSHLEKSDEK